MNKYKQWDQHTLNHDYKEDYITEAHHPNSLGTFEWKMLFRTAYDMTYCKWLPEIQKKDLKSSPMLDKQRHSIISHAICGKIFTKLTMLSTSTRCLNSTFGIPIKVVKPNW